MTTAENIASQLGNDGQAFLTANGKCLDELCEAAGASESWARTEYDYDQDRSRVWQVSRQDAWDHHRYAFPDGSAIVVSGDAWDVEGADRFSWAGS